MADADSFAAGAPLVPPAPAATDGREPTTLFPLDAGAADPASDTAPATYVLARFKVYGIPKPQGSMVPFLDRKTGQARVKASNEISHRSWRQEVANAAASAAEDLPGPLDGALALEVVFRFPMTKARPKADRLAGTVLKTTAPDTSKLVRSIEDSMEAAGLITNDARFAVVLATKVEVLDDWTGADIVIRRAA
jgi:Holliday junction resolvase RusA-like endonuclease